MIRLAQGDKVKKVRIFRAWFSQYSIDHFTDDGIGKASLIYSLLGLVVYTGNSFRGHYQCAVRVFSQGISSWLVCDDNQPPVIHQTLPGWMACRVSHIWMFKTADYQLWHWTPSDADVASRSLMDDVLALLRTQ